MTRVSSIARAFVLAGALAFGAAPAAAAPPSSPPPGEDFVLPDGWTTLVDDTNTITIAVPESWVEVDLAPESNADGTLVPSVEAATDIGVFTDTFDAPGLLYRAFAYSADSEALMDDFGLRSGCRHKDVEPYDDGAFVGLHGAWTSCGSTGEPEWHQIVASPESPSFTIVLQVQITGPSEQAIVDNVLSSFNFTPQGGSTPGPFPPPTQPGQTTTTAPPTTAPPTTTATTTTPATTVPATTVPATSATPTTAFPEPSGTVPPDAQQLVDDTGVLSIHVPPGWSDIDTAPYTGDSLSNAPYIAASTDLALFIPGDEATDTFSVPGVYYVALPNTADLDGAMRQYGTIGGCTSEGIQPYSDGVFTGLIQSAGSCGGTATRIVTVVANPADNAYTVVLLLQLTGDNDAVVYDTVLSSFNLIGPAAPTTDSAAGGDATTTSAG